MQFIQVFIPKNSHAIILYLSLVCCAENRNFALVFDEIDEK